MGESAFLNGLQSDIEMKKRGKELFDEFMGKKKDTRVVRMGLVGCGNMGGAHIAGLNNLTNCKFTCTCDIFEDRAEKAARVLGAEHVFTDYKDMLPYVDAVMLILPHKIHYEVSKFFVENGKHVSCEKPLCMNEEECLSLVEAAEKANVKLMCAYPVPHWPAVKLMKKFIDEKTFGDVIQVSIWTEQYTNCYLQNGEPERHTVKNLGGGQLFSHGCHYIDVLLRLLGNPITGIHYGSRVGTPWIEKEGTSNVLMNFENGALAYHFATWGARGSRNRYTFQIHFTDSFLNYEVYDETMTISKFWGPDLTMEEPREIKFTFEKDGENMHHTQIENQDFVFAILDDREPLVTGRDAIQSLRIIWKLYEAEEKGEIADLRGLGFAPKNNK